MRIVQTETPDAFICLNVDDQVREKLNKMSDQQFECEV